MGKMKRKCPILSLWWKTWTQQKWRRYASLGINLKSAFYQTKCNHLQPQFSALPSLFFYNSKVLQKTRQHARAIIIFFPVPREPLGGLGRLIFRGFMMTFLDTPHSVGLLWTRDQPVAETSTWQHTTLTRDGHPCPRRDSNPQSQWDRQNNNTSDNISKVAKAPSVHILSQVIIYIHHTIRRWITSRDKKVFKLTHKEVKQLLLPINPSCNSVVYNKEIAFHYLKQNESHPQPEPFSENVCFLLNPSMRWLGQAGGGRQKQIRLQWKRQSLCACCSVC
jgi:hypothetical protein